MGQGNVVEFKKLIDEFDLEYYEKENQSINTQIINIRAGIPRYRGIRRNDDYIVPKNKREKEIKILEKKIKENEKKHNELTAALSQLKSSVQKLENLAKEDFLLDKLQSYVSHREFRNIEKTEVFQKNIDNYRKLYSKSVKKIGKPKLKISKDIYKLIKKNGKLKAHKISSLSKNVSDMYVTIDTAIKGAGINLDARSAGNRIFYEFDKNHVNDLASLGVDVDKLNYVVEHMKGDITSTSLTFNGEECLVRLNSIKQFSGRSNDIKGGYKTLKDLERQYEDIVELSRECWYLENVLAAFKGTVIVESDMYKGLQEILSEDKEKLATLIAKADKLYDKSGIQVKIELESRLQELYLKIEKLNIKIINCKEIEERHIFEKEYYDLRYEMIKILKDNPELNKPEYNVDVKNIIIKEMELLDSEIRKGTLSYIKNGEKEAFIDRNVPVSHIVTPTEKLTPKPMKIDSTASYVKTKDSEMFIDKAYVGNLDKNEKVSLELDSILQTHRTMHYQNYMREKRKNSDLGRLPFSGYLEAVAPHLTELISIEKERERTAKTIYKEYLKYYASFKDKGRAMSFYDYAERQYNIGIIDVPVQYEEEYKGMKTR